MSDTPTRMEIQNYFHWGIRSCDQLNFHLALDKFENSSDWKTVRIIVGWILTDLSFALVYDLVQVRILIMTMHEFKITPLEKVPNDGAVPVFDVEIEVRFLKTRITARATYEKLEGR